MASGFAFRGFKWCEPLAYAACIAATGGALVYRLGEIPAGLHHDETISGYDARSLGRNLTDHFGVRLPLFFESVGDYKSPIYIYLAALNERVLGLTPFALRLTSVELALAFAIGIFFLVRALTGDGRFARWLALFALLIPSVFFYARVSTAENLCLLTFTVLALNALVAFERQPAWSSAAFAGAALGLCAYTYHVGRLLAPLMVIAAAVSYFCDGRTRRFVPALVASAALMALPMGLFMWLHPDTLARRFKSVGLWHDDPGLALALRRFGHTYLQHLTSLDFLFRRGQQQLSVSTGTGLLSLWLWPAMLLGLASLWQRRSSPFARFVLAMVFLSPIPVALTWENLPHTGRIFHLIAFALVAGALGAFDLLARTGAPRWLTVLLIGGVLMEGGQDLGLYFGRYAAEAERVRPFDDEWRGDALQIAFSARRAAEPLYLPPPFLALDGTYLEFYGDLDPIQRRTAGLEAMGIFDSSKPISADNGAILIVPWGTGPAGKADLLGTTPKPRGGEPSWQVYRLSAMQ